MNLNCSLQHDTQTVFPSRLCLYSGGTSSSALAEDSSNKFTNHRLRSVYTVRNCCGVDACKVCYLCGLVLGEVQTVRCDLLTVFDLTALVVFGCVVCGALVQAFACGF